MAIVDVCVPQLGEGLREALVVELLKTAGDVIQKDTPIYVIETDKSTVEIEAPCSGILKSWLANEGTAVAIGAKIAEIETVEESASVDEGGRPADSRQLSSSNNLVAQKTVGHENPTDRLGQAEAQLSRVTIPPRTRKYLKDHGLLAVSSDIPAKGKKLLPEDVDRFISEMNNGGSSRGSRFADRDLSSFRLKQNQRLERSNHGVVPATVMTVVDWSAIISQRQAVKRTQESTSSFCMFLWCVAKVLESHPAFRSVLVNEGKTIREYHDVNLGFAVALPEDELVTAVIPMSNNLTRDEFFAAVNERKKRAQLGLDQVDSSVSMLVSSIGSFGLRWGVPTLVPPATSTLVLGEIHDAPVPSAHGFEFRKQANLILTFDHRLMNGAGVGEFMSDLRDEIERFQV